MTRLERLCAERDRLTALLDSGEVPIPVVPQYVGQLVKVLADIEVCEKAQPKRKGTVLDELAARRGEAAGSDRAAGGQ